MVADDVAEYRRIRLAALTDAPDAFGSSFEIEREQPETAYRERLVSSVVCGGYIGTEIVGMAGLAREDGPKRRHKAMLWGVYVQPQARGRGIATALLGELLRTADADVEQVLLTVVSDNAVAIALYRTLGF
ncbi:MAG: GNAT family N-acetyltransferase, partial [Acetobacteraceae bacterium]|nr:GNAT family N-acetyltransferase [Acetobacteraceae bacterium]